MIGAALDTAMTASPGQDSRRPLSVAVFLYALAVFLATPLPGLSKLTHVALAIVLVLTWTRRGWTRGEEARIPRDALVWLPLLFAAYAMVSAVWAADQEMAFERALTIAVGAVGSIAVMLALWNGADPSAIVFGTGAGAVVNAFVAIGQLSDPDVLRAEGLTGNANSLAIQLSVAAMIALVVVRERRKTWALAFAVALVSVATIVSGSRKMVFVWIILVSLGWRTILRNFRRSVFRAILIVVGAALVAYLAARSLDSLLKLIEQIQVYERFIQWAEGRNDSANVRLAMIETGVRLWERRPLFGHGVGQFARVSGFGVYSHNNYVELLSTLGLVGFGVYYLGYVIIALRAARRRLPGVVLGSVALVCLWDVALVSHVERVSWLFLSVLAWSTWRRRQPEDDLLPQSARRDVATYGDVLA